MPEVYSEKNGACFPDFGLGCMLAVLVTVIVTWLVIGFGRIKALVLVFGILTTMVGYYAYGITIPWLQTTNFFVLIMLGLRMWVMRDFKLGDRNWYGDNWLG